VILADITWWNVMCTFRRLDHEKHIPIIPMKLVFPAGIFTMMNGCDMELDNMANSWHSHPQKTRYQLPPPRPTATRTHHKPPPLPHDR
jgi:hypothetical protein